MLKKLLDDNNSHFPVIGVIPQVNCVFLHKFVSFPCYRGYSLMMFEKVFAICGHFPVIGVILLEFTSLLLPGQLIHCYRGYSTKAIKEFIQTWIDSLL